MWIKPSPATKHLFVDDDGRPTDSLRHVPHLIGVSADAKARLKIFKWNSWASYHGLGWSLFPGKYISSGTQKGHGAMRFFGYSQDVLYGPESDAPCILETTRLQRPFAGRAWAPEFHLDHFEHYQRGAAASDNPAIATKLGAYGVCVLQEMLPYVPLNMLASRAPAHTVQGFVGTMLDILFTPYKKNEPKPAFVISHLDRGKIRDRLEKMTVPRHVGRPPRKLEGRKSWALEDMINFITMHSRSASRSAWGQRNPRLSVAVALRRIAFSGLLPPAMEPIWNDLVTAVTHFLTWIPDADSDWIDDDGQPSQARRDAKMAVRRMAEELERLWRQETQALAPGDVAKHPLTPVRNLANAPAIRECMLDGSISHSHHRSSRPSSTGSLPSFLGRRASAALSGSTTRASASAWSTLRSGRPSTAQRPRRARWQPMPLQTRWRSSGSLVQTWWPASTRSAPSTGRRN